MWSLPDGFHVNSTLHDGLLLHHHVKFNINLKKFAFFGDLPWVA